MAVHEKGKGLRNLLVQIGRIAGFAGILLCVVAVIWRALDNFALVGVSVGALTRRGYLLEIRGPVRLGSSRPAQAASVVR